MRFSVFRKALAMSCAKTSEHLHLHEELDWITAVFFLPKEWEPC